MDLMTAEFNRTIKFADVVGLAPRILQKSIVKGKRHFLLAGPPGIGKTLQAKLGTMLIMCLDSRGEEPCGVCDNCIKVARAFRSGGCLKPTPSFHIDGIRSGWVYLNVGKVNADDIQKFFNDWNLYNRVWATCGDCFPGGYDPSVLVVSEIHYAEARVRRYLQDIFEQRSSYGIIACLTQEAAAGNVEEALTQRLQHIQIGHPSIDSLAPWIANVASRYGLVLAAPNIAAEIARQAQRNYRQILNLMTSLIAFGQPVTAGVLRDIVEGA